MTFAAAKPHYPFTDVQHLRLLRIGGTATSALPGVSPSTPHDGSTVWDCALVTEDAGEIDVARAVEQGLPVVLLLSESATVPAPLLDAADGFLFADDPPDAVTTVLNGLIGHDVAGWREAGDTAQRMSVLALEAARISEALTRLARDEARASDVVQPISAALVRRLLRLRRDRDRHFPAELFADPAWDMLLDLTAARLEGQKVPVSSLCAAAAVPTTTALRWLRRLLAAGVLERHGDPFNARRAFVYLSPSATDGMLAWLRRFATAFAMR